MLSNKLLASISISNINCILSVNSVPILTNLGLMLKLCFLYIQKFGTTFTSVIFEILFIPEHKINCTTVYLIVFFNIIINIYDVYIMSPFRVKIKH